MTPKDFMELEDIELMKLPVEFRSMVSYGCYDHGHDYGYEEVLNHVRNTVDWLLPCIEKYTKNLSGARHGQ